MSLKRLHHINLRAVDVDATCAFARDFGLIDVARQGERFYMRGVGDAAYLLVVESAASSALGWLAFEVDCADDLQTAHAQHGASEPRPIEGPGGGLFSELFDPEGRCIRLVTGIAPRERDPLLPAMQLNQGYDKTRIGEVQRKTPLGPPPLIRLGHVGLFTKDWKACDAWYREVLGFLPSDLMYAGDQAMMIGGFYRLNRGDQWVDHHVMGLFQMGSSDLHHLSFEVPDPETQFMAHRWLVQRQREEIWGVGRHPLGSHVFDVWRDPNGFRFETFSDTDLLNASVQTGTHEITSMEMDLWSDRDVHQYFA